MIALTHNPDILPRLPTLLQLTLAGHTHGGQVNIPLLGRRIVPSEFGQRYAAGHIEEAGKHLFVTTGIGTSVFPVRFRVRPEIAVLTLRSIQ
jgi:predicted MPP superfamily phosphohydrolase